MSELFHQLGIDWRLFLSQSLNFLILLIVLRAFAYEPILKILKERQAKIKEGIDKAKEADTRLHEVDGMVKEKMKHAEAEAMILMGEMEKKTKAKEIELMEAAKAKEASLLNEADLIIQAKAVAARKEMATEAATLVRKAIEKTVQLKPGLIDEALIEQALTGLGKGNHK